MRRCSACGEENGDRARFCQACGAPLAEAEEPARETRKVVTVVFADVRGSTALGERLDPEALRRVMGRYFDEMRTVIERHGGTVEKFIGDAVMAVFGIPVLHEDDAVRAVRAAFEMRAALSVLNAELLRDHGAGLQARIGVNTGEVVAGDPVGGQRLVTGDAVNVAARLEQAAEPDQILLGETTFRLVRDAVDVEPMEALELKGKSEPVAAFRLLAVREGTAGHARHLDSTMVGRIKELDLLERALERAVAERRSHLFTVLGPAGVGKSRLVREFLDTPAAREATVLRGRCLSYGEGITFYPLAEVLQVAASIEQTDTPQSARTKLGGLVAGVPDGERISALVAGLFGWAEPGPTEEAFWAVRKLLEHLGNERPVILVIDDIHWAEPTFLDLLEHVADWTRDAALLLVCVARPELLDIRTGWSGGKMNATSILLEPLGGDEASMLIDTLLGRADIPEVARQRILEAAEGNPLFVEEMLAMLIDDGLLRFEDGAWRGVEDLPQITVPPTIQLLLAARLERLDGEERAVIERGSVEGKVFHTGAVTNLAPEALRGRVRSSLLALARKELIRPDRAEFAGDDAFRFRHMLIRDAAYNAIPKEQRAELHESFAAWLEGVAGDRLPEYDEIVGHHLERAFRYRQELGSTDERTRELRARAGAHVLASARRALSRGDFATAMTMAERAADLLEDVEGVRALLLVSAAREFRGDFGEALEAGTAALEGAEAAGDRGLALRARLQVTANRGQVDPTVSTFGAIEVFREIVEEFERMGDEDGVVRALNRLGRHEFYGGRCAASLEVSERLLPLMHTLEMHEQLAVIQGFYTTMYFGPIAVEDGLEVLDRVRAAAPMSLLAESTLLMGRAGLVGMAGRFDEAFELLERSRAIELELGDQQRAVNYGQIPAETALLAGRYEDAERILRSMTDVFEVTGETGFNSTMTAILARVVFLQGRIDEAERLVERSRQLTAEDDVATQNAWRLASALVHSSHGAHDEAIRLAREAIEIMEATDYLAWNALSHETLGEVLANAGRTDEARAEFHEALTRYTDKGVRPSVERVESHLAAL